MPFDRRTLEIAAGLSAIGGAIVGLHGVTGKRWQVARLMVSVGGAVALALLRYYDDGSSLASQSD